MGALFKSKSVKLFKIFFLGRETLRINRKKKSEFKRIALTNPLGLALGSLASSEMSALN